MASPRRAAPRVVQRPPTLDAFEVVEIHRSELKNAPYNPRTLSDKERLKLKRGIERHGFVAPPVWNARTGFIVGGHQRIAIRDGIEGTVDYRLKVARIDVDEAREREINLLLNNPEAQGEWDLGKLEEMLRVPDLDLDGTGFDAADVYRMFGESLNDQGTSAAVLDELAAVADRAKAFFEKSEKTPARASQDVDFYLVVVFRDSVEREAFTSALGLEPNRYQDGRLLRELIEQRRRQNELGAAEGHVEEPESAPVRGEGEGPRVA